MPLSPEQRASTMQYMTVRPLQKGSHLGSLQCSVETLDLLTEFR